MRFLIGFCTGAVVTLLVATAMDAPTHPTLSNAKDLAASGWGQLIQATSSSLFEQADEPLQPEPIAIEAPDEPDPAQDEPPPATTERTALEPIPALAPPEPVAESPSSEFWVESALVAARQRHADQPVWVPFHSQMSAEGFATRLSRALDHEFRVVRQGAGAYQVVFDAADADEQALIMAQVTEITGQ